MNGRTFKTALALAAAVVLQASRVAHADTITLHDLSENPATGVFQYTVQLDAAADVHSGDGFVIYDFPGLTSWSITGLDLSTAQFSLTQTLTSNILSQSSAVDANAGVAASSNGIPFDNSAVENLSFAYVGPPNPFLGATLATLTITSSVKGGITDSVFGSVDHSGSSMAHPFSFADNPVLVPAPGVGNSGTPLPASFMGGTVLFALLGLGTMLKNRSQKA